MPWIRLSVAAVIALTSAMLPLGRQARGQGFQEFSSKGEFNLSSRHVGTYMAIIGVGGGGGGSGATADLGIGRSGAGGGSGGVIFWNGQVQVTGPVRWTVGHGGEGGQAFGFNSGKRGGNPHGGHGTDTVVELPWGTLTASGGRGGLNVGSGYTVGVEYKNVIPPMGGLGGLPWGGSGRYGTATASLRAMGDQLPGGAGGSNGTAFGAGGVGGLVVASEVYPAGSPKPIPGDGQRGQPGRVLLTFSLSPISMPAYLSRLTAVPSKLSQDDVVQIDSFISYVFELCAANASECGATTLAQIRSIRAKPGLTALDRVKLLTAAEGGGGGVRDLLWPFIKSKLPKPHSVFVDFLLKAKGDQYNPPPPPLNPDFNGMTTRQLNVLYGLVMAAISSAAQSADESAAGRLTKNALREYANAIQEELINRETIETGKFTFGPTTNRLPPMRNPDQARSTDPYTSVRDWLREYSGKVTNGDASGSTCMRCFNTKLGERCIVSIC